MAEGDADVRDVGARDIVAGDSLLHVVGAKPVLLHLVEKNGGSELARLA